MSIKLESLTYFNIPSANDDFNIGKKIPFCNRKHYKCFFQENSRTLYFQICTSHLYDQHIHLYDAIGAATFRLDQEASFHNFPW